MKMINIGCGTSYHEEWVNIDLVSKGSNVIAFDLTKGLPFESNTFDVCYSSHVLEHLRKKEADFLIQEQKRILKVNGIIRVVIPDLEVICKNYLHYLEEVVTGKQEYEFRYDYTLLELFDQISRDRSGGEMGKLWASEKINDHDLEFIISRHGKEAEDAIMFLKKRKAEGAENVASKSPFFTRKGIKEAVDRGKYSIVELVITSLLGKKSVEYLREAMFRNSGEVHRIMYDRYSLKRLLSLQGFADITVCKADESRIPNFNLYQLDVIDGIPRKPDSLFMEANVPGQ